jgi:transcriptional regulator with XRE-family HTH domain
MQKRRRKPNALKRGPDLSPVGVVLRRLARRRKALGISQTEMDSIIGCAAGLVSKWECGVRNISPVMLGWYAEALGVELTIKIKERWSAPRTEPLQLSLNFVKFFARPQRRRERDGG